MELFFGVKISMAQLGEYYQEVEVSPTKDKEVADVVEGGRNVCDMLGVLPSNVETDEEGREVILLNYFTHILALHFTALHRIVLHSTVLHCTALCCTAQNCTELHSTMPNLVELS